MKTKKSQSITIRLSPEEIRKLITLQKRLVRESHGIANVTISDAMRYLINTLPTPAAEPFNFLAELKKL